MTTSPFGGDGGWFRGTRRCFGNDATIDAAGFLDGFVVSGASAAGTSVRGFTIVNAKLEGIFANKTSKLTIAGNTLMHNASPGLLTRCA